MAQRGNRQNNHHQRRNNVSSQVAKSPGDNRGSSKPEGDLILNVGQRLESWTEKFEPYLIMNYGVFGKACVNGTKPDFSPIPVPQVNGAPAARDSSEYQIWLEEVKGQYKKKVEYELKKPTLFQDIQDHIDSRLLDQLKEKSPTDFAQWQTDDDFVKLYKKIKDLFKYTRRDQEKEADDLEEALNNILQGERESLETYIKRFNDSIRQLKTVGRTITPAKQVRIYLKSLRGDEMRKWAMEVQMPGSTATISTLVDAEEKSRTVLELIRDKRKGDNRIKQSARNKIPQNNPAELANNNQRGQGARVKNNRNNKNNNVDNKNNSGDGCADCKAAKRPWKHDPKKCWHKFPNLKPKD